MKIAKQIAMISTLVSVTVLMSACSTLRTTVIPQSNNQYTVVATAEKGSTAINGGIKKAEKICKGQGKKLVVVSHKTKYQGAGKELGAVTGMVSQVAFATGDLTGVTSKTAEDYKSTVVFECK